MRKYKVTKKQLEAALYTLINAEKQLKDVRPSIGNSLAEVCDAIRDIVIPDDPAGRVEEGRG